ncbi:MAG: hypothetical protein WCJ49_03655 [Deltaproteobacteria bacterium]
MSNINLRHISSRDGAPVIFPTGIDIGTYTPIIGINNIGLPNTAGFGCGVCPGPLPAGMIGMSGYANPSSDNYGNYQYSDGSIMVWIPAFYYKYGADNTCLIRPFSYYSSVTVANTDGYALHRAFYDGGLIQPGFFVDKYQCSNNNGIASSIKNGNPLSSNSAHNPFSGLTGTPSNTYGGAIAVAKTRGTNFFCNSRFCFSALALLSYIHAQASTSTTYCAWYHATYNFPKGCNNDALKDYNEVIDMGLTTAAVTWQSDGYSNCGKTGSAGYGGGAGNVFAKSTHNGQNCGVADLNGNMWEITPGITSVTAGTPTGLYLLSTNTSMKAVTGGSGGVTDLWGDATHLATMYDAIVTYPVGVLAGNNSANKYGDSGANAQVFDSALSGAAWNRNGAGIPMSGGTSAAGTNPFGSDRLWDYKPNEMCPISGGGWDDGTGAGVWTLYLNFVRGNSLNYVGCRACLYL